MVIIQVAGGLGNQLQQYALYRKFVRLGREARLDVSWFLDKKQKNEVLAERELELAYFDRLVYEVCTEEEKAALIGEDGPKGRLRRKLFPATVHWFKESKMYHPELLGFENMYISGYFACEKYYGDILYDLREKIQFPPSVNPRNSQLMEEMRGCEAVSIHVRRGDYLDAQNAAMFGGICTDAYYKAAIALVRQQREKVHFYVFSDDIRFAAAHYTGDDFTIVDVNHGRDSFYDIQLMSCCKHNICANSTFSFWGARLNGNENKIMVRPFIHKNGQVFVKEEMQELWQGWSFVDSQGKVR